MATGSRSESETIISNRIRGTINKSGVARLWRNSTGQDQVTHVKYGLTVGSADLIGIRNDGRFVSIEVKKPGGVVSPEQWAWIKIVQEFGGLAGIAHNVDEAMKIIRNGK